MTGFRQIENLHAYSGGTVRDFHTILYSPGGADPPPQALKRIFTCLQHSSFPHDCQEKEIAISGGMW